MVDEPNEYLIQNKVTNPFFVWVIFGLIMLAGGLIFKFIFGYIWFFYIFYRIPNYDISLLIKIIFEVLSWFLGAYVAVKYLFKYHVVLKRHATRLTLFSVSIPLLLFMWQAISPVWQGVALDLNSVTIFLLGSAILTSGSISFIVYRTARLKGV